MIENLNGIYETISYKTENGIKLYHNTSHVGYPLHWHTGIEIIMPYKNMYYATIGDISFSIDEGDILLIPPGELHSLKAPIDLGERLILQFNYSLLFCNNEINSLLNLLRPFYVIKAYDNPALSLSLTTCLHKIETEYFDNNPFYESKIYSLLIGFFVTLGRSTLNFTSKTKKPSNSGNQGNIELFLSICSYINSNYIHAISLDDVAAMSGFSKSHFCRFFKSHSGKSFYDYLLSLRISHADNLLLCPENSIIDVALNSGFNSIATFNRVFKYFHNCSPTEFIKLHQTSL